MNKSVIKYILNKYTLIKEMKINDLLKIKIFNNYLA